MIEDTSVLPEYTPQPEHRTKSGLAVVASVVAVVLVAGGGVAAWQLLLAGGGSRPAEVLPASTFALATLDLDPSGGQKLEAIRTLRKFPAVREGTALEDGSDPMEAFFEELQEQGGCKGLDYGRDVEPWLGQRAAVGGVLLGDQKPAPVAALQVKDPEAARQGVEKLRKCAEAEQDDFGWAMAEDYLVISDSTGHAEAIVAAGEKSPLSDDAAYQRWTGEVGTDAVLHAYVARKAAEIGGDTFGGLAGELAGAPGSGSSDEAPAEDDVPELVKGFDGAAAALRFADGGIEVAVAGSGGKLAQDRLARGERPVIEHVAGLPGDTAALMALTVPEGVFEGLKDDDSMLGLLGMMGGIELPEDLQVLLGQSVSLSLGGDAPPDADALDADYRLPIGALVHGDEQAIRDVVARIERRSGQRLADLPATMASREGKVALAGTPEYAEALLGEGSLSDDADFRDAVPDADKAQGLLYVDVASEWRTIVDELFDDEEFSENLAVVRGLGASGWTDDEVTHARIRLTLE